jgi:hypothetical protein
VKLFTGILTAPVSLGREFFDLKQMVVYPNPYKKDKHTSGCITFRNVTEQVEIRIFSYAGDLVRVIKHQNTNGFVIWEMDNKNRKKVGTGLYFYYIKGNKHSRKGKIAVVR